MSDLTFLASATLRDYFAAHAPVSPQWHFTPRGFEKRPTPIFPKEQPVFPGQIEATNAAEIVAWDNARAVARMKQWPWVWADAMLAEMERE